MNFEQSPEGGWQYTAVDGDVVDLIAFNFYGLHAKASEQIFNINPGLAALGPVLPAGVVIQLPDIDTNPEPQPQISLWD